MAKRPERAGPLEYSRKLWLRLWLLATLLFLYAPIAILILFSFNNSRRNIVWQGFTLDYYRKAAGDPSLLEAFTNTLTIGLISTVISTVIGALLALALWRFRFPGKPALEGALALPIVIPEICMGVALLAFFVRTGWPTQLPWPLNLGPIVIGHIAFSFPFVAIVVRARMAGFDRALEEASKDLGAGEWQTFRNITLPGLSETHVIVLSLAVIQAFKVFDLIYVMTYGGPGQTTQVLGTWMYFQSFQYYHAGYGAAIAWVIAAIVLAIAVPYIRRMSRS